MFEVVLLPHLSRARVSTVSQSLSTAKSLMLTTPVVWERHFVSRRSNKTIEAFFGVQMVTFVGGMNRLITPLGYRISQIDKTPSPGEETFWIHNSKLSYVDALAAVRSYIAELNSIDVAPVIYDVGGGNGAQCRQELCIEGSNAQHTVVDIAPTGAFDGVDYIASDLNRRTLQSDLDSKADIVYSKDMLEHVLQPHEVAANSLRFLKPGGLLCLTTVFSWRLHAIPGQYEDYFRFSVAALEALFCSSDEVQTIMSGYDVSSRRQDNRGWHPDGTDRPPIDRFGGWRENWRVVLLARKSS